jgi:hypothetical protein
MRHFSSAPAAVPRLAAVMLASAAVLLTIGTSSASSLDGFFDPLAARKPQVERVEPTNVRGLPLTEKELTLQGEYARIDVPLHLAPKEALTAKSIRIKIAERAISSLPEAATLTVLVNGNLLATLTGTEIKTDAPMEIPVAPGILIQGFNALSFVMGAQHRVDCSVPSTFELWTRLDAAETGVVLDGATPDLGGATLPTLLQRNGAPGRLRVVLPSSAGPQQASDAVQLVSAIAVAGWAWAPDVSFTAAPLDEAGTNIFIGLAPSRQDAFEMVPGLWAVPSKNGRFDLAVTVEQFESVISSLASLNSNKVEGTAAGLNALAATFGRPVTGGETISLADLGAQSVNFAGRRMSSDFALMLPPDVVAGSYGTVKFKVNAAYGAGLQEDSELQIRINGILTSSLGLSKSDGDFINGREIIVPLQRFHPGRNVISIEAVAMTQADLTCDPAERSFTTTRFTLDTATTISFPEFARAGYLPNVATTVTQGFPYASGEQAMTIYLPDRSGESLATGATLAARAAVSVRQAIAVDVRLTAPVSSDRGGIVVAAGPAIPAWLATEVDLAAVTTPRSATELSEVDGALRGTQVLVGTGPADDSEQAPWIDWTAAGNYFVDLFARAIGQDRVRDFHPALPGDLILAQSAATADETNAFTASLLPGTRPNTWTVITSDTSSNLAAAVSRLTTEDRWDRLSGRIAVVRYDDEAVDTVTTNSPVVFATQSPALGNMRLTLASWLSDNVGIYVQGLVFSVAMFGALGYQYARTRKSGGEK